METENKVVVVVDYKEYFEKFIDRELLILVYDEETNEYEAIGKSKLVSMPMRKMSQSVIYANGKPYQRMNTFTDYDIGWNECLDEIIGEEE